MQKKCNKKMDSLLWVFAWVAYHIFECYILICVQNIQILKTVCNRTVKMLQIGPFSAKGLGQNPWPKTYFN